MKFFVRKSTPRFPEASLISKVSDASFQVKDASYQNPDVPPLAFSIDHSFPAEIDLEVSGLITTSTNSE